MSSIHSRNSSQALARYSSQLAANHQGRTHRSSSRYSKLRTLRGGLGVKVDKHGGMSGKVRPAADGKVSLPGGLTLQAPPRGGLSTHQLAPNKLLVLTTDARGLVSLKTKNLGLAVDEKKLTLKGSVLPRAVEGQKMVELPGIGLARVPEQGKTDSYLIAEDKLLSLKHEADGTVTVDTKTLGLQADKKGNFKGYVLPDANGKVDIAGKELDVSGLKPGQTKTKTIKIKGKKFKVKLRMNEDGSVTVQGKRKKGFFSKLLGGLSKVLSVVGKIAPLLALVPGIGTAVALAAKVAGAFNAAKGVFQSIKSGNILGAIGSLAGLVAGFGRGAFQAVANTVSRAANFAQSVGVALKNGLGRGILQVVSNGANLLSGAAGLLGNKGLAASAGTVSRYASAADAAGRGNVLPMLGELAGDVGRGIHQERARREREAREQLQPKYFFHPSVRFNTNPTARDFGLAEEPRYSIHQGVRFNTRPTARDFGHDSGGHSVGGTRRSGSAGGGGGTRNVLDLMRSRGTLIASRNDGGAARDFFGEVRNVVRIGLDKALGTGKQFADDTVDSLIRGLSGNNDADVRYDGMLVGVGGKTYAPGTALSQMYGVAPQGGVRNNQTVIYTNGVLNDVGVQATSMQTLANVTGSRVVGVHNATQGPFSDLVQSAGDKVNLNDNLAAETLTHTVLTELYAGRNVHLAGHSQGALVTSRALYDVRKQLVKQYGEQKANEVMGRIKVETFGGAATNYPDGPQYVHYVNTRDVVPVAVGLGTQHDANLGLTAPGRGARVYRFADGGMDLFKNHDFGGTYLSRRVPFDQARQGNFR